MDSAKEDSATAAVALEGESATNQSKEEYECAVCLQTCVHPVRLPCSHIFCFLCVKGVANQSKRCAMCRQEIPSDYLDNPDLLCKIEDRETEGLGYQWFYEGRNGWWQYDERTTTELENSYSGGNRVCEVLVAGFLYTIDFDRMLQLRRNDPSRRRRIKRDLPSIPKKGVAGLKTAQEESQRSDDQSSQDSLTDSSSVGTAASQPVTTNERHGASQNSTSASSNSGVGAASMADVNDRLEDLSLDGQHPHTPTRRSCTANPCTTHGCTVHTSPQHSDSNPSGSASENTSEGQRNALPPSNRFSVSTFSCAIRPHRRPICFRNPLPSVPRNCTFHTPSGDQRSHIFRRRTPTCVRCGQPYRPNRPGHVCAGFVDSVLQRNFRDHAHLNYADPAIRQWSQDRIAADVVYATALAQECEYLAEDMPPEHRIGCSNPVPADTNSYGNRDEGIDPGVLDDLEDFDLEDDARGPESSRVSGPDPEPPVERDAGSPLDSLLNFTSDSDASL